MEERSSTSASKNKPVNEIEGGVIPVWHIANGPILPNNGNLAG